MGLQNGINQDALTEAINGAAIDVHRVLGPGLLESAYEVCLCDELRDRGIQFQHQVPLPVVYKGRRLDCGYRLDLLIDRQVVVEIKAIDHLEKVHDAQLLTYLRLTGLTRGLLINFNVPMLKDGIRRRVLNHIDSFSASSASLR